MHHMYDFMERTGENFAIHWELTPKIGRSLVYLKEKEFYSELKVACTYLSINFQYFKAYIYFLLLN